MGEHPIISIVDDDPSVRKALSRLFRSVGYDVSLFENSETFLEAEAIHKTDCLVLDVHLPGMSGLELQQTLSDSSWQGPIVFISAFQDEDSRKAALKDGAIGFLGKPLDVDQLLQLIERALNQ